MSNKILLVDQFFWKSNILLLQFFNNRIQI